MSRRPNLRNRTLSYGALGAGWIAFIALAYLAGAAPESAINFATLTIFWSFYCCTLIILCDATRKLLEGRSLLDDITASRRAFWGFVATGAISGILLDGIAQWLGKFWIYPYWNTAVYGSTFVLGFCAYWLCISETYVAARAILRRLLARADGITEASRPSDGAGHRFSTEGAQIQRLRIGFAASGAALLISGVLLCLRDYSVAGGYVFDINSPLPFRVHYAYPLIAFVGSWILLEYLESRRHRTSLAAILKERHFLPFYSMLIASYLLGAFIESTNATQHLWRYMNWPWQHASLDGVPVSVIALWPLQYILFLSVHCAVGGAEAADIWI